MMALGDAGRSMCEAYCSGEHLKNPRDLATAIVPASCPARRGNPQLRYLLHNLLR